MPQSDPERAALQGARILVVEDTLLVAEVVCDLLEGAGCVVVGPVPRLGAALALAQDQKLDGAVLDINLAGEWSLPVAATLDERAIPFIFVTGYDDAATLPSAYHGVPRLAKPFSGHQLIAALARRLGRD